MPNPSFQGLRVLTLESRRAAEIGTLVRTFGGEPVSAPALREVPGDDRPAVAFAAAVGRGEFDVVVLMTGVGVRALLAAVDRAGSRDAFVAGLARVHIAARGPKPIAVLRELGLAPWVAAPEPNTWRELLIALDAAGGVNGRRVAVQEYGRSNPDLLEALRARGASVTSVPVFQYALPDDVEPLERAVDALIAGTIDVVLLTTGTQALHVFQVADQMERRDDLRRAFARVVVASIGPSTSEALIELGLSADLEPSYPKMGILVREAAERAAALRAAKRLT
ncbi:MAG: uroporphyrinogen-III synthase [Vicinamibacterales bacterium]